MSHRVAASRRRRQRPAVAEQLVGRGVPHRAGCLPEAAGDGLERDADRLCELDRLALPEQAEVVADREPPRRLPLVEAVEREAALVAPRLTDEEIDVEVIGRQRAGPAAILEPGRTVRRRARHT